MPNVSHGSVHDGSPFAIPGTIGVNFKRGEFVSLNPVTELAVAFDANLQFLGVVQRSHDLTNATESGSIPFGTDSVNTVLIVNRELPFANSGGPVPFPGAYAFADSATTFTLDDTVGKFCGIVRMVDQVNGLPLWIVDTKPGRARETAIAFLYSLGGIVVGAEVANVIPVTMQVQVRGAAALESIEFCVSLRDSVSLEPVLASVFTATVTTGTLQAGSASARPFILSDASGVIGLDIIDVVGASGRSLVMVSDYADSSFPASGIKVAHPELITFD